MNATQKLLEYIKDPEGTFAYFDIDMDYIKSLSENDNDPVKQIHKLCDSVGNPCFAGFGDITQYLPELKPTHQVVSETETTVTEKIFFNTPIGKKGWVLTKKKDSAVERISEASSAPVSTKEDFALFDWFYETVKNADWSEAIKDIKNKISQPDKCAITSIFLVPPFELLYWTKREEMFFLYFDYPEEYHNAMNKIVDAYDIILDVAEKAGINAVGYGAPGGTEFTSPKIWEEAIVPSSVKLEAYIKSHGLFSIFHCCGKISTIVEAGFINDISPTIFETLSPPPVGDVAELKKMRQMINKDIITHGNIDLTFLRDSSADEVKKQAMEIAELTKGYPHIVGAADACLWPGTPTENLRVVCEMFN